MKLKFLISCAVLAIAALSASETRAATPDSDIGYAQSVQVDEVSAVLVQTDIQQNISFGIHAYDSALLNIVESLQTLIVPVQGGEMSAQTILGVKSVMRTDIKESLVCLKYPVPYKDATFVDNYPFAHSYAFIRCANGKCKMI